MNPVTKTPDDLADTSLIRAAGRLVLVYAVFAGLWIWLSDELLARLVSDPAQIVQASTYKGWLFVAATSLLLYGLLRRLLRQSLVASMREQEAQSENHRSQQLLTALIDSSTDAIFAKDLAGRYLLFNHETTRVMGTTPERALGHDDTALFPPEQAELIRANDQRVLASNRTTSYEETLDTVDGERVFLATKGPLRDSSGQVIGLFGISRDITDRKRDEARLTLEARRAEALLTLPGAAEIMTESAFMQHGQELAEQLTGSQIAVIHLVHDDQETIELVTWSRSTLAQYCSAAFDRHYPISQAGVWADALRQRAPVVINDYASVMDKHGLPEGHAQLDRLINVPVIDGGLVRMMAGVGNKPEPYTEADVETVRLIADAVWRIVRQRRAETALHESEQRHRLLADNASDVIWTMDLKGRFTYVSPSVEKLRGFTSAEVMQQTLAQTLCPSSIPVATEALGKSMAAMAAGLPFIGFRGELEQPCKDGSTVWTEISTNGIRNEHGEFIGIVGVSRNIAERKVQQQQLQLAAQVFAQGREGITVTDALGHIIMVNRAFSEITGYTQAEVLGQNPRILKSGRQSPEFYLDMWAALTTSGHWAGEIWNRQKDGTVYPEWLAISALRDSQGQTTHYVASFSDLSSAKAAESRIQWLSQFDTLTGLPNRTLLQDRTELAISMVQRAREPLTMLLVAIDHFGAVNDTLGHQLGDELLVEMARRLSDSVREQDTVSRMGGKEFVLVLPGTPAMVAAHLATELLWKLSRPCSLGVHELTLTASIGIASFPDNGGDFDTLFKAVEIAMHRAQVKGRDTYQFYSDDLYEQVLAHDRLIKALRQAIVLNQLQLVYQPQVDLQTGQICGVEALLRWQHPELGAVSPGQFIPLAEESGLIIGIGEWVLRRACQDIRRWLDHGIKVPHVAINASPLQFRDNNLVLQVKAALTESQIDPALIYIEVTESALMDDVPRNESMLKALKDLGIKLSLDDFGTGYSSLSYLKRFPFDQVKIDRSFVQDIATSQSDSLLVKVIVSMAHGLGMKVIAEGVETEAQCEIMRTSICDEIQGYFFCKPISAQAIEELFSEGRQLPAHLLRLQKPQRTLLLVDDEPNILASLKRLFRRDGHLILTANSGAEGLELLSRQKVDLIISDQRMPGMTGVEFLRAAKALYPDTIRIVLSGYTELQSVTDAINEGAVYRFLTKPWEDEPLREHINKAFEYKELQEENRQLDIKIRTTNQELIAANRQLGDILQNKRYQIERDETSLAIAREALQHMPLPVIGVDDEGLIAFANVAAEHRFADAGALLGIELARALPAVDAAIAAALEGTPCELMIDDTRYLVKWNPMGLNSRSRGKIVTLIHTGPAA